MLDWFNEEETEESTPTKMVGLVHEGTTSPLYCEDCGDHYNVVNGAWSFDKETGQMHAYKDRFVKYEIIVEDMTEMKFSDWYNEACEFIRDEAEKKHAEVPKDLRGFIRDGSGTRDGTLLGAWTKTVGGDG